MNMVSASAPGRLDVMGGIADYSGSLVLQMPISEQTRCSIETHDTAQIVVRSEDRTEPVIIETTRLRDGGDLAELDAARAFFAADPERHWASYVVGTLLVFHQEIRRSGSNVDVPMGMDFAVESDVPEGKGVSSSAALEVATIRALCLLTGVQLSGERMATLCQIAENRVAGAPCGIMDQMTSACGERGRLLRLVCQPAVLEGFVDIPDGVSIWGIDSGVRHAVTGSDYGTVRAAAFMGLRILETIDRERIARGGGYLVNVGAEWVRQRADLLPESMDGQLFLNQFDEIADDVVTIDPSASYPIRAATLHPVLEHDRIQRFADFLERGPGTKELAMAGELMYLSHAGYTSCGLGSEGTDRIVELVHAAGYKNGLFGARITGGGSGGTVAVLGRSDAGGVVREITEVYREETGRSSLIF